MASSRPPDDRLTAYRAKRAVERTPEPAGTVGAEEGRLVVVHKHAARQLHWDLRLAVKLEDHPLEYGEFEAVIPPGRAMPGCGRPRVFLCPWG